MANEGHFYERKIVLLAKEDQIEADFERMVGVSIYIDILTPLALISSPAVQVGH